MRLLIISLFCLSVCVQAVLGKTFSNEAFEKMKRDEDENSGNENKGCPVELIKNASSVWIDSFNSGDITKVAEFHDEDESVVQSSGLGGSLVVGRDNIEALLSNFFLSGVKLKHLFKTVRCPCPKSFVEITTIEQTYPGGFAVVTFDLNMGRIERGIGGKSKVIYEYNNFGSN